MGSDVNRLLFHSLCRARSRDSVHKPQLFLKRKWAEADESNLPSHLPHQQIDIWFLTPSQPRRLYQGEPTIVIDWVIIIIIIIIIIILLTKMRRNIHSVSPRNEHCMPKSRILDRNWSLLPMTHAHLFADVYTKVRLSFCGFISENGNIEQHYSQNILSSGKGTWR